MKKRISKLEFGLSLAKVFNLSTKQINKINYESKKVLRPNDMSVNISKISKIFNKKNFDIEYQLYLLKKDANFFRKELLKF